MHRLQQLFQAGSESRSVGLDLSRRPPSAGQAPLAVLRGSLGLAYVQLSCVTNVGLVCVVQRYVLTELKEYYYYYYYEVQVIWMAGTAIWMLHRPSATVILLQLAIATTPCLKKSIPPNRSHRASQRS